MNPITAKFENGCLTLFAKGRIDSSNASDADKAAADALEKFPGEDVVVDAGELTYISSAGLRVILRVRKQRPKLKIVNVSSDVYEILEMTGFTEMLPVEKAYRRISVDGCEVIGQGANGKVYRLDPDTIIKVYLNPDCLPDIHRERELARRAFVLGVPTAIPYDVVRVGDGYGSVFELLNAKSLAKLLTANPERMDEYVKMNVDLLKIIHGTEVLPEDMPDMREVALNWAKFVAPYLDEERGKKLVRLVEEVPVVHRMLHGDYHVKNVMVQNGEVLLIDMDTLCQGHPIFEFASMFNAYIGFGAIEDGAKHVSGFLGIPENTTEAFFRDSLKMYFGTEDRAFLESIEKKAALIGFTRIYRRSIRRGAKDTEKGRRSLAILKEKIDTLLDEVDTLLY